ncbi:hypothetical protein, conserved [Babesia bigemina]|uniref:DWNN domain-containing protein n=1 Tax=Babesia bigemina TaxID=5866 RepID=A0A061DBL5_BABBI|nr:hypothetical protein, conserved [Babesia bigemina]CDR97948.1 hypothetical protein, conserved [Babesia bigemina]|eukprot:XP_012770134.1 hypothetical protein, conserved [Babesia bigemina]
MVSTGGVIFYRFGSERGIWRELQLDSSSGILVSDLKIMIAQETSLSKDFTRKTNLIVCLYDENSSEEPKPLDDNVVVHVGSRVLLNRIAWTPATPIFHEARTEFDGDVADDKPRLRPFPVSLLCKLCGCPMKDPVLVKCSANCGSSGCCACLLSHFADSLIKNEEGVETAVYTLSDRRSCPFCTYGFVSAFLQNRQMAAVLLELDFSNFDIPTVDSSTDAEVGAESEAVVQDKTQAPKHFLICVDNALIDSMREHMLLPVYIDSVLCNTSDSARGGASDATSSGSSSGDTYAIVVSYVGGGTSLSPMGLIRLLEDDPTQVDFIRAAYAHTARRFEWVHNNTKPLLVPARRQPLFSYLAAKRYAPVGANSQNEVLWRHRNDLMTEVGLTLKAFESLFQTVFGEAPPPLITEVDNDGKNWLEAVYAGGPPPLYINRNCQVLSQDLATDNAEIDTGNPYLGYLAILPFLSESQFLKMRELQRNAKEEFLQQFTAQVVKDLPEDTGIRVLEKAYNNVWKRHVEYEFPPSDDPPEAGSS